MTDTENVFDGFALLGDDEEFDVDKIFGSSSDEPAPPPPAPDRRRPGDDCVGPDGDGARNRDSVRAARNQARGASPSSAARGEAHAASRERPSHPRRRALR